MSFNKLVAVGPQQGSLCVPYLPYLRYLKVGKDEWPTLTPGSALTINSSSKPVLGVLRPKHLAYPFAVI